MRKFLICLGIALPVIIVSAIPIIYVIPKTEIAVGGHEPYSADGRILEINEGIYTVEIMKVYGGGFAKGDIVTVSPWSEYSTVSPGLKTRDMIHILYEPGEVFYTDTPDEKSIRANGITLSR